MSSRGASSRLRAPAPRTRPRWRLADPGPSPPPYPAGYSCLLRLNPRGVPAAAQTRTTRRPARTARPGRSCGAPPPQSPPRPRPPPPRPGPRRPRAPGPGSASKLGGGRGGSAACGARNGGGPPPSRCRCDRAPAALRAERGALQSRGALPPPGRPPCCRRPRCCCCCCCQLPMAPSAAPLPLAAGATTLGPTARPISAGRSRRPADGRAWLSQNDRTSSYRQGPLPILPRSKVGEIKTGA
jgi:hypothetical protein